MSDDDVDLGFKADGPYPLREGNRVPFVKRPHNPSNESRRDENDRNFESLLFEDEIVTRSFSKTLSRLRSEWKGPPCRCFRTTRPAIGARFTDCGEAVEVASVDHRLGRRLAHSSIPPAFAAPVIVEPCLRAPIALIYDAI